MELLHVLSETIESQVAASVKLGNVSVSHVSAPATWPARHDLRHLLTCFRHLLHGWVRVLDFLSARTDKHVIHKQVMHIL